jgi:L-fuconolactonase
MPDIPIVDTHLHLWDPARLSYPWLADVPTIAGPHLIDDYRRACEPVNVAKMVFVQCECDRAQYMDELAWVSDIAKQDPRIEGIVPWAPLEKGDAAREDLDRITANKLVKGIRRIIQHEPDGNRFARQPEFIRGVQLLADYNLSFDLCIGHIHMQATIELVRQCPDTRFILDHIGKPDIRGATLDPWRKHMRELAALPNVWCKMSGVATEADFDHWTPDDLAPYIDHALSCFGFDRTMFGGDWPVATLATDYPRWVRTLDSAIAGVSDDQRRKLYFDNAVAFYRLPPN